MRYANIDHTLVGKRLGATIYDERGQPVLRKGVILTTTYIQRLKKKGFSRIYIENELAPDIELNNAITEETRVRAVETVRKALTAIESSTSPKVSINEIHRVVRQIVDEISGNTDVVYAISALRNYDDYTFVHSVNVTVLTLILGRKYGLTRADLDAIGVGALLHDIGKMQVPKSIVNKPGRLTEEEFAEIKKHPIYGFELLRKVWEINLVSAHIAYQHHERLDGSGYPRGLSGDEIHLWSRLAAVADVYDALTADRPYRGALTPHEALGILREDALQNRLDERAVHLLTRHLAIYPDGSIVRLNDGHIAVVVRQTDEPTQPVVRVVADPETILSSPWEEDLRHAGTRKIALILPEYPRYILDQLEDTQQKIYIAQ